MSGTAALGNARTKITQEKGEFIMVKKICLSLAMVFLLASCTLGETPLADSTPDEVLPTDTTPTDSPSPQEIESDEYIPLDREDLIQAFKDLDLHHGDDLSIIFDALGRVPDSGTDLCRNYLYESTDGSSVSVRSTDDSTILTARFHDAHDVFEAFFFIPWTSWQIDFDEYTPMSKDELVQAFNDLNLQYGDDLFIIFQALGTVLNRGSGTFRYHYESTDGSYVRVISGGRTIIYVRFMCEDEGFAFVDMAELARDA